MNKSQIYAMLVIIVFIVGCSSTEDFTETPITLIISPTPTPIPETNGTMCNHPLWPILSGSRWIYLVDWFDGEIAMESHYIDNHIDVTFDGQTTTFTCINQGIAGMPPGVIGHPDLGHSITGRNPRGYWLLPPDQLVPAGSHATWEQELDAGGTIYLPSGTATITGGRIVILSISTRALPVDVPAGSFSAQEVEETVFFEIEVAGADGSPQSVLINTTVLRYYAEGVGIVQVIYQGGSVSSTTGASELRSGLKQQLVSYVPP